MCVKLLKAICTNVKLSKKLKITKDFPTFTFTFFTVSILPHQTHLYMLSQCVKLEYTLKLCEAHLPESHHRGSGKLGCEKYIAEELAMNIWTVNKQDSQML